MRAVIMLAFLAILVATASVCAIETVSVGGDFGVSWLNNLPYQPAANDKNATGLWDWGGTPRWMKLVNGTLQPVNSSARSVDYLYPGSPGSSGYSDDPWIQAQLTGRVQTTPLKNMIRYVRGGYIGFLGEDPTVPW